MERIAAFAGSPATYRRGGDEMEVCVSWGRTEVMELTNHTVGTVVDLADAIIVDYTGLLESFGTPQSGDEIVQDDIVRQVLPAGGDEHCYRWMGPSRQSLRIHTKIVSES